MNQQPPQWRPPAQPWRPPPGGAMPHAHGGTGGPPPYGATGYGPPGYGPPPAKKRMPTIGAVVALVGGLLGALQAVLPWLALVGVSVNGFGVNSLAAGHLTLVPELKQALADQGAPEVMIVVGGVIPPDDVPTLLEMGAAAVFPPGTVIADSALGLIADLSKQLGHDAA